MFEGASETDSWGTGGGVPRVGDVRRGAKSGLIELDTIAAGTLGGVHGLVGAGHQGLGRGRAAQGKYHQPQTGPQRGQGLALMPNWGPQIDQHPVQQLQAGPDGIQIADAQDEFVPADAEHQVMMAEGLAQAPGDLLEDDVAHLVAEAIVDRLEAIQIQVGHRQQGLITFRLGHHPAQGGEQCLAIEQAREMVGLGDELKRFSPLALGGQVVNHLVEGACQASQFVVPRARQFHPFALAKASDPFLEPPETAHQPGAQQDGEEGREQELPASDQVQLVFRGPDQVPATIFTCSGRK